ncbi:helix-turn-helix domain-containing protein [Salisediminibacterium halotolerans]|uniref:XRE family transcriptional regulator, master regulator for biofilm formation n=1 Tax=Salisediminibacterium halotolerans TaxID=517425 RepID=A0A1H9QK86_9BACI|nr:MULTISPECIES: helix-turn-helix domain-containing protein [Salisediminibacterium]RLJ75748.1 transcriptional regulator [Actinophytocola xinjiangensis]RPE89602.1 transcriptional regulator [Salisediminibacterium halotolerans]TWG36361.1 transcriptional regulator [Salisediminibacterium halotolerans]SER60807.1 XRE family transcriptional regulator, master regulator for biofilm formation [Salisediminibacterium haloalkalitolerans]GEL09116.1 transcriptional regulator [Salisediminibacterium halotoleran
MIGERVKKYRKEAGLTITQLAERAGVAKSYLSALERNLQQNPSIAFLEKLAAELNIKVDYLIKENPDDVTDEMGASLDPEWANLVKEAMHSGVSKDEFKDFLEYNKWKMKQ